MKKFEFKLVVENDGIKAFGVQIYVVAVANAESTPSFG